MEWARATEGDRATEGRRRPVDRSNGGSGRILVCDDTEQIRQLIRVNLELEGYEVLNTSRSGTTWNSSRHPGSCRMTTPQKYGSYTSR